MATLTPEHLDAIRQQFARDLPDGVPWSRHDLNDAAQAIEDAFSSVAVQNVISTAIDDAIAPHTMTNQQKRQLVKWYLKNRFDRGN